MNYIQKFIKLFVANYYTLPVFCFSGYLASLITLQKRRHQDTL